MKMDYYDTVIVGAGPAGLAAAGQLSKAGRTVLVVESSGAPGGQLVKQIHKFFGSAQACAGVRGIRLAQQLFHSAQQQGCQFLFHAAAYAITQTERGYQVLADLGERTRCLYGRTVLLALGASENAIAFPGWTKPGVMTAGAAQTMVNLARVNIGKRVLMIGAGNVGLIVSYQLLQAGIEVAAVLEAAPKIGGYQVHANKLLRAGVPVYPSHTILEAGGEPSVEYAVIAQVDKSFQPLWETKRTLEVDTICLAVGLSPLVKLAAAAGCRMGQDAQRARVVWHDEEMMTSQRGVFVAGDVAGVEEASIAMEEGVLAAAGIETYLGGTPDRQGEADSRARLRALRKKEVPHIQAGADLDLYQQTKGFKAVIECYDGIPCNPCQAVCPTGAVEMGEEITQIPRLSLDRCIGCGKCVTACPGMACFLLNYQYSPEEAEIAIPYEYFPLPKVGMEIQALSRTGEPLCRGRVTRVVVRPEADQTAMVSFTVPKRYAMQARAIDRREVARCEAL